MHYLVSVCIVLLATEKASWRAFTDSPDWRETRAFEELAPPAHGTRRFSKVFSMFWGKSFMPTSGTAVFHKVVGNTFDAKPAPRRQPIKVVAQYMQVGLRSGEERKRRARRAAGEKDKRAVGEKSGGREGQTKRKREGPRHKNGDGPGRRSGPSPPDAIGVGGATRRGTPCGRRRPPGAPPRCRSS